MTKMRRIGRTLTTAAAVTRLYSMKYMLVKPISPMVTVFMDGEFTTTRGQNAEVRVQQAQPDHPEIERHDHGLKRHHQDADDGEEEHGMSRKSELGEAVAGEGGHDEAAHGRHGGEEGAVEEEAAERRAAEYLAVVLEVAPMIGGELERHALDLGRRLERREGDPHEGEDHRERARRDEGGREPAGQGNGPRPRPSQ